MKKQLISIRVNGRAHEIAIAPSQLLLECLRQDMGLTGSERAWEDSSCGACTVLLDGVPVLACATLAVSVALNDDGHGPEITTVEGIAEHGALAAIQKAYGDWGGAQCGFCTPGFMCTVSALLAKDPDPKDEAVRQALSSNLCRCTGYMQMYQAIRSAIDAERKGRAAEQK